VRSKRDLNCPGALRREFNLLIYSLVFVICAVHAGVVGLFFLFFLFFSFCAGAFGACGSVVVRRAKRIFTVCALSVLAHGHLHKVMPGLDLLFVWNLLPGLSVQTHLALLSSGILCVTTVSFVSLTRRLLQINSLSFAADE
jgi:hypothetical protein